MKFNCCSISVVSNASVEDDDCSTPSMGTSTTMNSPFNKGTFGSFGEVGTSMTMEGVSMDVTCFSELSVGPSVKELGSSVAVVIGSVAAL